MNSKKLQLFTSIVCAAAFLAVQTNTVQALETPGNAHQSSHLSSAAPVLRHTNHFLVVNIRAQASDRSATVTWDAPLGVYGSQVVAYKVNANYKDPKTNQRVSLPPVAVTDIAQRTVTITGLMNGVWHDFTVTAQSTTEWSAVNTNNVKNAGMVKPSGLPCAASTPRVVAGNSRMTVSWNRPCNGGDTVKFSVNVYVGGQLVQTKANIADTHVAPIAAVTNLTNGTYYQVSVTSTNVNGSVTSPLSDPVTPRKA